MLFLFSFLHYLVVCQFALDTTYAFVCVFFRGGVVSSRLFALKSVPNFICVSIFSRGYTRLLLPVSVGPSVRWSVRHVFELRTVLELLLRPNHPRLDCRVSGLVSVMLRCKR